MQQMVKKERAGCVSCWVIEEKSPRYLLYGGLKENDVKDQKISGLYLSDSNIIECIQAHIEDNLKPIFSNILDHDEGFEVLTKFGIHN